MFQEISESLSGTYWIITGRHFGPKGVRRKKNSTGLKQGRVWSEHEKRKSEIFPFFDKWGYLSLLSCQLWQFQPFWALNIQNFQLGPAHLILEERLQHISSVSPANKDKLQQISLIFVKNSCFNQRILQELFKVFFKDNFQNISRQSSGLEIIWNLSCQKTSYVRPIRIICLSFLHPCWRFALKECRMYILSKQISSKDEEI